jgi:hypothetical protein
MYDETCSASHSLFGEKRKPEWKLQGFARNQESGHVLNDVLIEWDIYRTERT